MQESSEQSYEFEQELPFEDSQSSYKFEQAQEESSQSIVDPPISNLKTTFAQLDRQGKGFIRKSALKQTLMLTSEQFDPEVIKQQIELCDQEINYKNFVSIFQTATIGDKVNKWLFTLYDQDMKGFITAQDLKKASAITDVELSEEQIVEMLTTERNRGSGRVDFQDFKYFMEEELQYM